MSLMERLTALTSASDTATAPRIFLDLEEAAQEKAKKSYRHHVLLVPCLRALGMPFIALAVLLHDLYLTPTPSAWTIFWRLLTLYALYSVVSWIVLFGFYRKVRKFNLGQFFLLFDIILFLVAIYYSGGEKSWLFFLMMVRTADQTRTTRRKTILFAFASTVGYVLLIVYLVYFERRTLSFPAELTKVWFVFGSNIYLAFVAKASDSLRNIMISAIRVSRDLIRRLEDQSKALQASEARYRLLAENAMDVIWTVDMDMRLTYVSPSVTRLLGFTAEEAMARTMRQAFTPPSFEKAMNILAEEMAIENAGQGDPNRSRILELELVRKDGSIVPVEGNYCFLRDPTGNAISLLAIVRDITERKEVEEERRKLETQLFHSQRMESVGRLAGGVAHDFNNMLAVILGRSEMALESAIHDDRLRENLQEILKAGKRSADLTRQLMAFARKQTAAPKILDLNNTIAGTIKMLQRLIGEDIDLVWVPGHDIWTVKIDPSQLDQILANLVVNARDAISGVGSVTMRTEKVVIDDSVRAKTPEFIPGDYVLLTVTDTGAGMSKEVSEKIFEPFFTTKELGKGTGLGLSTVYGIVKQNDGFIYATSQAGQGTTFKIYLPRFEAEAEQDPSEDGVITPPKGTETILLVEDDEAVLDLTKISLQKLGYTVIAAKSPGEAISLTEEHQGDLHLLVTDVVMPEMNGRELFETLRATSPGLKCLYMSGYTADVITHRGILDEGVNFIQKPFVSNELGAKVKQALDDSEAGM